ncbi:Alpha/beta hydrolase-1 [Corchorus olitorius]|uniref:Alpha/beta hydrolase-1 n=1 Tax=Corchorus olitorius TaxID=93759 RepID=A0A1R3K6H9_9ROSI|nr:Alpha/beta hydrolase-1 [Corchorus olitorius]
MALVPPDENVSYDEEFIKNSRGLKLFTCKWIPAKKDPKALIFICHGYAMECSITMSSTAIRLVKEGFAVYGIDYESHGKSSGLEAYIQNFDDIINDCSHHFTTICEKEENKGKKRFLLGESMGGAVALFLHKKMPDFWHGAILAAPMYDIKPSPLVTYVLRGLCWLAPTSKAVVTKDIIEVAFKEPEIREEVRKNPYCYKGPPRLKTSYELLRVSLEIENTLNEVKFPFLVLHGEEDKVTDPQASKELYNAASSKDKTLKLYPGMWHGMLYGEPLENIEIVFSDIIGWLDERTCIGSPRSEIQRKHETDNLLLNNKL